jgi:hypothetical protein
VRQALKRFGLVGAVALECEGLGLGRCDRSAHAWLGPGEVHDDNEPEECEQHELRENMIRYHGVAPSHMG